MISILIPTYNVGQYIRECIGSILNQTYKHFELIIVDDGSTDDTVKIIKSFRDRRIKVFECEHKGIVDALNFGWEKCSGEYIVRMDADDVMTPTRLEKQFIFMTFNRKISVGYAHSRRYGFNIEKWHILPNARTIILDESYIGKPKPIYHPTVIIRKKDFDEKNLRYDKEFEFVEDHKLWDDAMKNGLKIAMDTKSLVTLKRTHDESTSKVHHERQQELLKKLFN